jgi:ankyrin repeat protein
VATTSDLALMRLIEAVIGGDTPAVARLLAASPALACASLLEGATRASPKPHWREDIKHYLYAGDTALHAAAAAYRHDAARQLIAAGADIRARNRRGAEPLHYAVDGGPGSPTWNPHAQVETVTCLIEAGADPNAFDLNGAAPLHRAVRNRCAEAVRALLAGGADVRLHNQSGSSPMLLAMSNTGRGGTGTAEAKAQQSEIIRLLQENGAS